MRARVEGLLKKLTRGGVAHMRRRCRWGGALLWRILQRHSKDMRMRESAFFVGLWGIAICLGSWLSYGNAETFEVVIGTPATEAVIVPFCVDFDDAGNLYGVEFDPGHRFFRLGVDGHFSFLGGQEGVTAPETDLGKGDGGPVSGALFNGMHDLAVTREGKVYLADTWAGRIRLYDPANGCIERVLGSGPGKVASTGDGGPALSSQFRSIYSCALSPDESRLYLVELDSHRVRYWDLKTGNVEAFAGTGEKGEPTECGEAVSHPLQNPRAVTVDPRSGVVYLVDRNGNSLQRIDLDGTLHTVVNASGEKGYSGDGGKALDAAMRGPKYATTDQQGRVVIADAENHVIRRYDPETGEIALLAGTPGQSGDEIREDSVLLKRPHGVRISRDGKWLYIVDSYNNRVLRTAYR